MQSQDMYLPGALCQEATRACSAKWRSKLGKSEAWDNGGRESTSQDSDRTQDIKHTTGVAHSGGAELSMVGQRAQMDKTRVEWTDCFQTHFE